MKNESPQAKGMPAHQEIQMRRVRVMKNDLVNYAQGKGYALVEDYVGKFHTWGMELWEQQEGSVTYSVALVEKDDGTIATVPPSLVQFIS